MKGINYNNLIYYFFILIEKKTALLIIGLDTQSKVLLKSRIEQVHTRAHLIRLKLKLDN